MMTAQQYFFTVQHDNTATLDRYVILRARA